MLHGLQPYEKVWRAMQEFTDQRDEQTEDEIWVLQHEPVFTQGQAGKEEHILAPGDIPVVPVDRGGQVTYHGPGQLVIYLMLDINRMGIGARDLVSRIEQALVNMLALYGIQAAPKKDAPGVYVGEDKIASLGLRIRHGRSFHGLSLNIDMNLEPFGRINPCGYQDLKMVQLCDFQEDVAVERAAGCLVNELRKSFSYDDIVMEYKDS
ncbi:lipoyl(octanoyl) transferase LipB [Oleiphilus sp. HI0132]|nr:lipoyl(octanoyl) transferase LipB [Oleiphilus sp. HI0132]